MAHRLFVVLRPPEAVRDRLIDTMEGLETARWQGDEQLHLTLRFLGDVETPAANDLAAALGRLDGPAFDLHVEGVGTFDRRGSPKALWARVPPTLELEALRQRVERACEATGLGNETRRFTPHITLARLGGGSGAGVGAWLARHGDLTAGPWTVDSFVLYQSHLGHEGAHYEPVARYPLRG
jgi:RNA 2',3'-cyclic 3'-phosphodiesterase